MDVAELERNILAKLSPTLQGELCYQGSVIKRGEQQACASSTSSSNSQQRPQQLQLIPRHLQQQQQQRRRHRLTPRTGHSSSMPRVGDERALTRDAFTARRSSEWQCTAGLLASDDES